MERPFLSVVVPCYNSRKFLPRLLQSAVDCEMSDMEVILVDDCSDETYDDIVEQFDTINISQFKTDHNCGSPSNSRELGASKATGIYLTFIDHDDYLIPEGIQEFRKLAEASDYPEYVCCGIRQVDEEGNTQLEKFDIFPFLHGKFFHMDKFYKPCNLHHKKDIKYQEDNYFTALIGCILIKYNMEPRFEHFCTYAWFNNENSLGRRIKAQKEVDAELNLAMFNTNMMIPKETFFVYYDNGDLPEEVAQEWMIREIVSTYLDCQIYWKFIADREAGLRSLLKGVKERLKFTNEDILEYSMCDDGRIFLSELESVMQFQEEKIVPHQRFEEFLETYS